MKKRRKVNLLVILSVFICLVFVTLNSVKFKFLLEVIKLSNTLPTISTDFYNDPIDDITYEDITYKKRNGLSLKLDLYENNNETKPKPVIIYVFGDAWIKGEKVIPSAISPLIELLKEEGYAVIRTSYELMKEEIIFDKQISDVKDTIRWVYKNKDKYNFDIENIGLIGPSAGAHLAMMAAYSENDEFIGDSSLKDYPSQVKYVVDLFGPAELSKINLNYGPREIVENLSKNDIKNFSKLYSPISYVKKNLPDTLIIHSKKDEIVPYDTSISLYKKCIKLNNDFKFYTLEDCNHCLEGLSNTEALKLYMEIVNFIISENN